jgi:hypothetical protein
MRFSKVILVWDNDGQDLREDVILKRTVTSLTRAGKEVWLLVPPLLPQEALWNRNRNLRNRNFLTSGTGTGTVTC